MASYGEIIDNYDPARDLVYKYFTTYFRNPMLTKIKDTDKHSMYLTKLYCLLNRECRYIIVFIEKNLHSPGTLEELKTMNWISFQTRTLTEQYNDLEPHGYEPLAEGPLSAHINKINITKEISTYNCDEFPIIVTLLHTEKNTPETYQKSGTIINALETFHTIITFINDPLENQPIVEQNIIHNRTNINQQQQIFQNHPRPLNNNNSTNLQQPTFQSQPRPINNNLTNLQQSSEFNKNYHPNMQTQPRPSHTRPSKKVTYNM